MTKSFAAMGILILRDQGKLSLDDPASKYIPEMRQTKYLTTDAPAGTPPLGLSTGDRFVADAQEAAALARVSSLVDMEGYAVARVAAAFGVPVRLVKTVSDSADDDAVRDWQDGIQARAEELGLWVHRHLYGDAAPG